MDFYAKIKRNIFVWISSSSAAEVFETLENREEDEEPSKQSMGINIHPRKSGAFM